MKRTDRLRPMRAAWILAATALLAAVAGPARAQSGAAPPLQTVARLDVQRYMGTWYEIAKYPNWFQRNCASDTQAQYRLLQGSVQVFNRCRKADGQMIEAQGLARQIGGADSPKLQVRFAPAWLSFVPWVWGDYWIVDLDDDYQLVAISEPRRDYLWILSRSPTVEPQRYQALLARLKAQGLDPGRLEPTPQR